MDGSIQLESGRNISSTGELDLRSGSESDTIRFSLGATSTAFVDSNGIRSASGKSVKSDIFQANSGQEFDSRSHDGEVWRARAGANSFFRHDPTFDISVFYAATVRPNIDNTSTLGTTSARWSELFAANGTINTSDAREKTELTPLTKTELAAAIELSKEIGGYKWLASIESKGSAARYHIGLTVQKAIEVLESHGLNALSYGFICYDEWEDQVDKYGLVLAKKGNRYGFRYSQLNMFILAGINARLELAGI